MRSEYMPRGEVVHVLGALFPENRLALEVSLFTGLRINDVLALKSDQIKNRRFSVREQKTGKIKKVYLSKDLQARCIACSGQHYVFEHRLNGRLHRTRQAVYKDLARVAEAFRVRQHLSPHSMRKIYAVEEYAKYGDLKKVQNLLNHSDEAVTIIYAMANIIDRKKHFKGITNNRNK